MSNVKLIVGNISFTDEPKVAIVHEKEAEFEVSVNDAESIGEHLLKTYDAYLIPTLWTGKIIYEDKEIKEDPKDINNVGSLCVNLLYPENLKKPVFVYDANSGELYNIDFVDNNIEDRVDINIDTKLNTHTTDYLETYYEVACNVGELIDLSQGEKYELTKAITDRFQDVYKDYCFDGDFLDKLDDFINAAYELDQDKRMIVTLVNKLEKM